MDKSTEIESAYAEQEPTEQENLQQEVSPGPSQKSWKRILREAVETVLLAALVFVLIQTSVQNFRVRGGSMEPTISGDQYLLINKLAYMSFPTGKVAHVIPFLDMEQDRTYRLFHSPNRGEVIVFHFPQDSSRYIIKRIIGIPGDLVELRSGSVMVNGTPLDEPYVELRGHSTMAPRQVPPNHYFVLGDNRINSNDSRNFGPVPDHLVKGKAWLSYWPLSQLDVL